MGITCTCLAHNIVDLTLKLNFENSGPQFFKLLLQSDASIYSVYLKVYANHLKGVQVYGNYQPGV